ncbi:MAG: sugar phosphate isomerase/epimerase [Victivallales bacterium]|nr:sugar phosphate isomerase/epimerase [Victivallales bacterium]
MKYCVSSYSFAKAVKAGVMTEFNTIAKAKEMGFDAMEFSGLSVPEGGNILDVAKSYREEAARVGIEIVNFCASADMMAGSNGDLAAEVARVQKMVDVAATLGVKTMRQDPGWGRFPENWTDLQTFDAALPRIVQGLREITEYAQTKGIKTMIENHGYFVQESLRVEKLLNAVNHPNFGLLIDIGNFICADDDPAVAVGRLAPFALHVHIKDFHLKPGTLPWPGQGWNQSRGGNWWRGAIIGHGNVPVHQCIRTLLKYGYDGALSVEVEGMEDPLLGISIGLANIKRFVQLAQIIDQAQ